MNMGKICAAALVTLGLGLSPALADKGKGHGPGKGKDHRHSSWHCPPGLAKKDPACVPPGQAKKRADAHRPGKKHHHHAIGDRIDIRNYDLIRYPRRFGYDARDDWRYYRDGSYVYRIDRDSRRVLAVLELIDAFSN